MENAQKVEAAVTSTVDTLFAVGALFKEAQEERAIEERRRAGQRAKAAAALKEERAKAAAARAAEAEAAEQKRLAEERAAAAAKAALAAAEAEEEAVGARGRGGWPHRSPRRSRRTPRCIGPCPCTATIRRRRHAGSEGGASGKAHARGPWPKFCPQWHHH